MKVIKYNISKAGRKYQGNDGQEKTVWDNVGIMTEFHKDGGNISRIIEIPAIGLNASLFPIDTEKKSTKYEPKKVEPRQDLDTEFPDEDKFEYPEQEIDPEDIPF